MWASVLSRDTRRRRIGLRSHRGRTPMQNAEIGGDPRDAQTCTGKRKPAWADPLLTFMVRRGSTVRVR